MIAIGIVRIYEPPPETSVETIKRYGELGDRGGDAEAVARTWTEAGFDDGMTARWLEARCFDPQAARGLADLDVGPEQSFRPHA